MIIWYYNLLHYFRNKIDVALVLTVLIYDHQVIYKSILYSGILIAD